MPWLKSQIRLPILPKIFNKIDWSSFCTSSQVSNPIFNKRSEVTFAYARDFFLMAVFLQIVQLHEVESQIVRSVYSYRKQFWREI